MVEGFANSASSVALTDPLGDLHQRVAFLVALGKMAPILYPQETIDKPPLF